MQSTQTKRHIAANRSVHTSKEMQANLHSVCERGPTFSPVVSWLRNGTISQSLSHFLVLQFFVYLNGCQVGFYRGDVKLLMDDIGALKPTIFPSVPRLLNRLYDKASDPQNCHTFKAAPEERLDGEMYVSSLSVVIFTAKHTPTPLQRPENLLKPLHHSLVWRFEECTELAFPPCSFHADKVPLMNFLFEVSLKWLFCWTAGSCISMTFVQLTKALRLYQIVICLDLRSNSTIMSDKTKQNKNKSPPETQQCFAWLCEHCHTKENFKSLVDHGQQLKNERRIFMVASVYVVGDGKCEQQLCEEDAFQPGHVE